MHEALAAGSLQNLLDKNVEWAKQTIQEDPDFFSNLSRQQSPEYLWIGCSDSRVPATNITGMVPGEIFVHRNVSNRVDNADRNLLAVLQFAIQFLKVKHIIVCGHYGCGGVKAAMLEDTRGPLSEWVYPIKHTVQDTGCTSDKFEDQEHWIDEACELNVLAQIQMLEENIFVKKAREQGQELHIHGWIYGVKDGLIKNLIET